MASSRLVTAVKHESTSLHSSLSLTPTLTLIFDSPCVLRVRVGTTEILQEGDRCPWLLFARHGYGRYTKSIQVAQSNQPVTPRPHGPDGHTEPSNARREVVVGELAPGGVAETNFVSRESCEITSQNAVLWCIWRSELLFDPALLPNATPAEVRRCLLRRK